MGSLKLLAMAGLVAAASTAASAADLLPPPPPVYAPVAPAPVEIGGGWYLRGDIGVGVTNIDEFENVAHSPSPIHSYDVLRKSIDDQVFVGIGAGYQFNNWLRADVTGEYRTAAGFSALERATRTDLGLVEGYSLYTGRIASLVGLANVYADLGTWSGITPFVGAGIGVAHHSVSDHRDQGLGGYAGGLGLAASESKTGLAWALHAGLGYQVSSNLKLELGYRYLNMGDIEAGKIQCLPALDQCSHSKIKGYDSHDFKIGMRWLLASSPAPVVYEQPLIRRY
jgi:opacity protein-like surface antigen